MLVDWVKLGYILYIPIRIDFVLMLIAFLPGNSLNVSAIKKFQLNT